MAPTRIDLDIADGAAWIRLDGPETRNALDLDAVGALVAACDRIDADRSIGVAIVTGVGPAFCAGADRAILEELPTLSMASQHERLDGLYAGFRRFGMLAVPTVAAVNGAAVGAGVNLALAADLRVLTNDAVLTSGFARLGIHPGGGHLHLLDRASDASVAAAMGVFARPVDGPRAVQLGLAWAAVPPGELRATVDDLVVHLANDPELARALAASFRTTIKPVESWDRAIGIERERQAWSLARPRKAT